VKNKYGIIKPEASQKIEEPIPTSDMTMNWVPKVEWKQIFTDTWRRHRYFFYDPNMQGVDWDELRIRYSRLVEDARIRSDINNLQASLVSELSAGHTYSSGGDMNKEYWVLALRIYPLLQFTLFNTSCLKFNIS